MNEYHNQGPGASQNPPPLIGGFPFEFRPSPVFSVDKLTLVGNLKRKTSGPVYEWSARLDVDSLPFAVYPYRYAFQSQSGVYFAFKDPGAAEVPDVRIEFNPNNQTSTPECLIQLLRLMKDIRPTRLDLAIDYQADLSGYQYSTMVPKAGAIWYGRDRKPETFYLGKRSSGSMYRIYNKAREQGLTGGDWWRIEQEIHLRPGEDWRDKKPFDDLRIVKPAHFLNVVDAAVLDYLKAHPSAWAELTTYQRKKYRKMINGEEDTVSLMPRPQDVFTVERWKVDAILNEYVKLMDGKGGGSDG